MSRKVYATVFFLFCILALAKCQNKPCPCLNPNYCLPVTKEYGKELVAFYAVNGTDWKSLNWTLLTTIVVISPLTDEFLCYAHSRNVRLTTLVSVGQNNIPKLMSQEYRASIIKTWLESVQNNFMDGINIDMEDSVYAEDFKVALVNLTREATAAFKSVHEQYQITWDVPYSPRMLGCITGWCYDFYEIAEACDFLIVMSYDAQLNVITASANSPLQLIEEGYDQYIIDLHINPDKLVMAVPWYGYDFECIKMMNHTGVSLCLTTFSKKKYINFKGARQKLRTGVIAAQWDKESESPYLTFLNENGTYHQWWYDDVESLTFKYKFAVSKGLHGLGMFTANDIDYTSTDPRVQSDTRQMWDTITYYTSLLFH